MLIGCKTLPNVEPDKIQALTVDITPELVTFDPTNPELNKIVIMQADFYSYSLKLLLDCKATGMFTDSIDDEIQYCRDVIAWIASLTDVK